MEWTSSILCTCPQTATSSSETWKRTRGNHHAPNHTIKRKLRICLDPRDLNETLDREPYHTCSVDEITAKLQRYDSFHHSRLQERILDGGTSSRFQETHLYGTTFWQIPMDKIAHGYSGCPGHFPIQAGFHFIGMEGVTGIADDMVISGRDEMKHDRNFLAFMEKCMSNNPTLNLERVQFKQSQILSMATAGQNKGFHQIKRRLKLSIIWNSHWTKK